MDEVRKLGKDLFAVGRMVKLTHQIELTAAVGEEKVGKWSPVYCFFKCLSYTFQVLVKCCGLKTLLIYRGQEVTGSSGLFSV